MCVFKRCVFNNKDSQAAKYIRYEKVTGYFCINNIIDIYVNGLTERLC